MKDDRFRRGLFLYNLKRCSVEELKDINWNVYKDGYLHFSSKAERFKKDLHRIEELLINRFEDKGYLMEVGLWGSDGNNHHELYLERSGKKWKLKELCLATEFREPENGWLGCFFRSTEIFLIEQSILFRGMEKYPAFEIVVPDHRINIFIPVATEKKP